MLDVGCLVFSRKMRRREGCRSGKESRRVPNRVVAKGHISSSILLHRSRETKREIERQRERDIQGKG